MVHADVTSQRLDCRPLSAESSRHVGKALLGRLCGDVTMGQKICDRCGVIHPLRTSKSGKSKYRRCPVKRAEQGRRYRAKHPDKVKETSRRMRTNHRWYNLNREQRLARNAVTKALEEGRMQKQPCAVCGDMNAHAHHENYSRKMDVTWLCSFHHGERHREINASGKSLEPTGCGFSFCRTIGAVNKTQHIRRLTEIGYCFDGDIDTDSFCGWVVNGKGYDVQRSMDDMAGVKVCKLCRKTYEHVVHKDGGVSNPRRSC